MTVSIPVVLIAGAVCLFGTWVGMRHFARARATTGSTRYGWLFMASVGTGAALWASTFISILALDPQLSSGFEPVATAGAFASSLYWPGRLSRSSNRRSC